MDHAFGETTTGVREGDREADEAALDWMPQELLLSGLGWWQGSR